MFTQPAAPRPHTRSNRPRRTSRRGLSGARLALTAGLAISAAAAIPSAALAQAETDTLPVRRITLYRSGVGYFQREGSVSGDADVQLRFSTDQINDILKSLVLLDMDGGRIDAVSYASKEPLGRRLASFGVNISDNPSIPELLGQLRGAPVSVTSVDGKTTGTILGVENRLVAPKGDQPAYTAPHLNLVTTGGIKSIEINAISSFEILDKDLAGELNKALAALAEYRADNTKTVDLKFSGKGSRRVVVAYIHETPVWKTSYRLVLPEPTGQSAKSPFVVQGWAIVENTTDQDWNNVQLGLVSGRPVSFVMDLYEPLFTDRPEVPVPTIPGVAPRAYAGAVNEQLGRLAESARRRMELAPAAAAPAERGAAKSRADGASGRPGYYDAPPLDAQMMTDYAAQAQAQGGLVGEVFKYELNAPVTIERQRSAMLPIINANLDGRRVSIYSAADGAEHPMRGVEITNDTDLQLLPGPISVFDGAAYAGDAEIGHIAPGDKRLLAYAVDLDVGVITKADQVSNIQKIRIVDGLIEQTFKRQNKSTYAFDNQDEKLPRTIIVEQPRIAGWDLAEPAKPSEQTQGLYRFEMHLAPGKSDALTVVQERVDRQSIGVAGFDLPTAIAYNRQGKLSDKVLDVIKEVARRQSEINTIKQAIRDIDQQVDSIHREQDRIRSNMNSVRNASDLYARYVQKLDAQETQLENLTNDRQAKQTDLEKKQADLDGYIRGLNVQ